MNEEINDVCEYPIIWFVCGLIFGGFCMPLADKKGYSTMTAFWLGLFFSIAVLIYYAGLPVEEKKDE